MDKTSKEYRVMVRALELSQDALEAASKALEDARKENTRGFVRSALIEVKEALLLRTDR